MPLNQNRFELQYPIDVGGRTITEITLRRPKFRDLERVENIENDLMKTKQMVGDLGDLTPDEVAELDILDFKALAERVGEMSGELEG